MFLIFLFISTHILFDLLSLRSAEAYIGWDGKLNGHLMARCVRNICTKNYFNLLIGFQVTVENVGDVLWDTVYINLWILSFDIILLLPTMVNKYYHNVISRVTR